MSVFRLSAKQYPDLSNLKSGDTVSFKMKAKVMTRMMGGTDDVLELQIDDLGYEQPESRQHPAEIMKDMAILQGLINTPTG